MRRRSLTRLVALVTTVTVFAGSLTAFADTDTATTTDATTTTTATDDTASDTAYVSEMLEKNYTKVSSGYQFAKYTGDTVEIAADQAWVSTSGGTLTSDNLDYKNKVVQMEIGDEASFTINAPADGVYNVSLDYLADDETTILPVEMSMTLNGETPFYEARRLLFESNWSESGETQKDRYGNEIVTIPDKVIAWQNKYIMDASYRYTTPLSLQLKKGANTISFKLNEGSVKIGNIYLQSETKIPEYKAGEEADGKAIYTFEAEDMALRNDSSIRAACEYDPDLTPYSLKTKVLNIVDSASFNDAGSSITYDITVKKDGYYNLAFAYRQADKVDFPVFCNIAIDGTVPNTEMMSYPFDYTKTFENETLQDSGSGDNMAFYLTKGTHTITVQIANDNLRASLEEVDRLMSEINELSLEITKVVGNSKDKYRDLDVTEYIPDAVERLNGWADDLEDVYDNLAKYSDKDSVGTLSSIKVAVSLLRDLADNPQDIPFRKTELSQSNSSVNANLANLITSLNNNKLSFDKFYVYQKDAELPGKMNFFVKIWKNILRFFYSFGSQAYSTNDTDEQHLQVWVNRSRQYIEIMQQMIDDTFTKETGIKVDLSIMPDQNKLILANAAGEAPDVGQSINYVLPFDLGIRGAIKDLTEFDDYQDVLSRVPEGLLVPSTIGDGIYSLPETINFWVLYYRTDVLEKLDLPVPQTIDDVKNMIPELKNRGLDFYYPTAGTVGKRIFAMTTPLFYQHGASLYESALSTSINSEDAIEAFTDLTDLFTIYNIQKDVPNFYQHFRNGDIPIGISDFAMYNMLVNAAPEIANSWDIALVPGVEDENGVVQHQTAGGAESTVIFKSGDETLTLANGDKMDREDAAWEYLKWWSSAETQTQFGSTLQATYGKEFMWNTANSEAFQQLPWKSDDKAVILEQTKWMQESPWIPGTYLLERELSDAYVAVAINGGNLRTSIDAAVKRINRETKRKLEEFGYIDDQGNVLKEYNVPSIETVRQILGTQE